MATETLNRSKPMNGVERRGSPRLRLQVPLFVRGTDAAGDFLELTKTINIGSAGACIACSHLLRIEQVIHLTIPAPSPSPSGLVPSETPPIAARVRRHEMSGDLHLFGVEFLNPLD